MKLRKSKKGFTVVELVIVIAVIAVLAAILIPTFISLDSRAKKASDQSLVRNLNNALVAQEAEDGEKNATMHDAVLDLEKWGYKLSALVTKSGEDLLWSQKDNLFVLSKEAPAEDVSYWRIQDTYNGETDHSVYAADNFKLAEVANLKVGFDAGYNLGITSVQYNGEKDVVIRTAGGTLQVNAPSASLYHYGNLDTLDVKAVKAESYHETGSVVNVATLTSGRIVVEKGAYIKEVDTTNATSGSSLVVDGYVNTVTAAAGEGAVVATGTGYVADNNGTELGSAENVSTSIKSLADLHLFRDRVNIGAWDAHLSAKLDADLDLTGVVWTPIGNSLHPFAGTFNGQGHVVKGLTNAGYESDDNNATFTTSTSMATGYAYGLFGIVGSTTDNAAAVTLKNVSFEEVNINCQNSNMLGALVGADVKAAKVGNATINADYAGNIMIDSVKVAGSIKALDSVGGIAGKLYTLGRVTLNGCENSASVSNNVPTNPWTTTDSNYKVSGLLGYRGYSVITVTNCTNSGSVFKAGTKGFGSAIANVGLDDISGDNFIRSGNANTGTVTWQQSDGTLDLVSRNYFFNYRISAGGLSND